VVLGREDIQIVDAEKLSRLCVQAAVA
jgi:hypothetical protein